MPYIIGALLFVAYTGAIWFLGYTTSSKKYAAAEAAALVNQQRVLKVTQTITQYVVKKRQEDKSAQANLAAAVEKEIAAHPAGEPKLTMSTSLLNAYITQANAAADRVYGPTQSFVSPSRPIYGRRYEALVRGELP